LVSQECILLNVIFHVLRQFSEKLAIVEYYQQFIRKAVKQRFVRGNGRAVKQNCLTIYLNCKDYAIDSKYYNSEASKFSAEEQGEKRMDGQPRLMDFKRRKQFKVFGTNHFTNNNKK
jgi:hypothetical protein